MVELSALNQILKIDAGELVGYQVAGHEYIHQKGSPGWRNSDTEMFPIIGPSNEAGFRVQVPKGNAIQDQHGLLRELEYEQASLSDRTVVFKKKYTAGTPIRNSKYPEKSTAQWLIWPFNFKFLKTFELKENGFEVRFTISGERDMPFMLGYHPAFKLHSKNPVVVTNDKTISLAEVLEVGSRAMPVLDCDSITLKDEKEITLKTEGFGNFMLWTEVSNMICLEPITFYPYAVDQHQLHSGFEYLESDEKIFVVRITINN